MTNAVGRALRAGAGAVPAAVLTVVTAAVLTVAAAVLTAGCGARSPAGGTPHGAPAAAPAGAPAPPPRSRALIAVAPGDGARDVPAAGPLAVSVGRGTLTEVAVRSAAGVVVPGAVTADRRAWRPTAPLRLATQYTVDAYAVDDRGRPAARHSVFTTAVPRHTFVGFYTPEDGATVGPGMIVSLRFTRPITDRAAVEHGVTVTADPPVPVRGHWFGDRRLDLRPAAYWRAGTRVTLALRLRGVRGAADAFGVQSKDVAFTIGRDQRTTVDAAARTMTVRRGGAVLRTLPVSAGSPEHPTYSGVMVIAEKFPHTRMNGRTVGFGGEYDIPDVPHAMRLTRSGTFVHGNYWSPPEVFGAANVSHGCVGLADTKGGGANTPAGWFFAHSLVGDPVRVVHSRDRTVAPDNGMGGWNLSWGQWLAGSAGPAGALFSGTQR